MRSANGRSRAIEALRVASATDELLYSDLDRVYAEAVAAIEQLGVDEPMCSALLTALHDVIEAERRVRDTAPGSGDDWLGRHLAGEPGYVEYFAFRRRAVKRLCGLIATLSPRRRRPAAGYTTGQLMSEAGIGRDLWQTIRKKAGIGASRGDTARMYSRAEISRLIAAAQEHATTRSRAAAIAWQRLLDVD